MPCSRSSLHHPRAGLVVGQRARRTGGTPARSTPGRRAAGCRTPRRTARAPRSSTSKTAARLPWMTSRCSSWPRGRPPARPTSRTRSRCRARSTCRPGPGRTPCGRCPCRRAPRPGPRRAVSFSSRAPPSPQTKFLVSWKLERREAADAAERLAAPAAEEAVRVVLDDRDVGTVLEDLADAVDVAGDAAVVHHDDRAHGVVEQLGEVLGVGAEGLGLDVAEEDLRRPRGRRRGRSW